MWHKLRLHLARLWLQRQIRRRPPRPLSGLNPARVGRVLLINSTALGDLMFSTPALRALKERFPAWEVDLLVQPGLKSLVLADPRVSRCWTYPGGWLEFFTVARRLQERNYDLVIILHGNDPEVTLLAWLTRAPYLIGSGKSPLSFAYSHRVPAGGPGEHAIERRLNFVRPLGISGADRRMEVFLPPGVRVQAGQIFQEHFGTVPPLLIALHPGGSDQYKRWPLDHFALLGKYLYDTYGACFFVISSSAERELARSLADRIGAPALVSGGGFDLLMVAGLLSHCRLFVGNDSGPLHLALALQVPSLGLLGADDPRRIGPYRVDWGVAIFKDEACPRNPCLTRRCPRPLCLEAIAPEEVFGLVQQWWAPKFWQARAGGAVHDRRLA